MNKYILAVALLMTSNATFATPLSAADKKGFYTTSIKMCIETQKNLKETSNLKINQIEASCACVWEKIVNSLSYEEIDYMERTGDNSRLEEVTITAMKICDN